MSQAMVSARARTCARTSSVGGKQGRLRMARLEPVDDGQALDQPHPLDLERRHEALRIAVAILLGLLLALEQVHRHRLIGDPLEIERDADPVAGRGAVIIVEKGLRHRARTIKRTAQKRRGVPRHAPGRAAGGVGDAALGSFLEVETSLEIEHALEMERRQAEMGPGRLRMRGSAGQLELGHPALGVHFDFVRHRSPPTHREERIMHDSGRLQTDVDQIPKIESKSAG